MPSLPPPDTTSLLDKPAKYPGSPVDAARGASTCPLSFSQQRLWVLDKILPIRSVYTVAHAYRIIGMLNTGALQRALGDVVARHDILRTRFALTGDGPVQVIAPAQPLELSVVDLGALADGLREPTARRIAQEEARAPFDLEKGMPLRVRLLALTVVPVVGMSALAGGAAGQRFHTVGTLRVGDNCADPARDQSRGE